MARKGRRKGSVRTGAKKLVERVVANARYLAEHPEHAVPQCQGRCPFLCTWKKARKDTARIHAVAGDQAKLKRLSRRGHPLAQAYAAALRLADAGAAKVEYMQNVRTPRGLVAVAPWGKAPSLAHVGIQHRHDPSLRVLAAAPFVKPGDAVFAAGEGLVCAHDGEPPEGAIDAILEDLALTRASPALARCPHVQDDWTVSAYLEVSWPAAGLRMRACKECLQGNTLSVIGKRVVARKLLDLVDVRVQLPRFEDPEGGHADDPQVALPEPVLRSYAAGELSDLDLLGEAAKARKLGIEAEPEPKVVYQNAVYHPPFRSLLDQMDPPPVSRELLTEALARLEHPVVLERGTPTELLHAVWAEHGERALRRVLGEEGRELFDPEANMAAIDQLLSRVERELADKRVREALPVYEHVPAPVDLADRVARAHLAGGRAEAARVLASAPGAGRAAVAYALVRALGVPTPSWTIDPREAEHAEELEPLAGALIEARGEAYHEALVALQRATGSTEEPVRAKP